jgi:hypothetical protein
VQTSKAETKKNEARYSDQSKRRSEEAMRHMFSRSGQIPLVGIKHSGNTYER